MGRRAYTVTLYRHENLSDATKTHKKMEPDMARQKCSRHVLFYRFR